MNGVRGYIADGAARDVSFILENEFPTFCRFNTPKDIVGRWIAERDKKKGTEDDAVFH